MTGGLSPELKPSQYADHASAFRSGEFIGHSLALINGFGEMIAGGTSVVGGTAASTTGVGAVVGVPAAIGGAALYTHGTVTTATAAKSLIIMAQGDGTSSGTSPDNTPDEPAAQPTADNERGIDAIIRD